MSCSNDTDSKWDIDHDPKKNPQFKRKQQSSPTPNITEKTKTLKTTKVQRVPKVPTTTDTVGALCTATKATEYAR